MWVEHIERAMTTHESLHAAGARYLRDHGYREDDPDATGGRDHRCVPGSAAESPFGGDVRPVTLVTADRDDPATLCHRLAAATAAGQDCLFVAPGGETAAAVAAVFESPTCVSAVDDEGCRSFYPEEDRVRVGERGFALVRGHDPTFDWHEEPSPGPADADRAGTDARALVLDVDGDPAIVLDGVSALGCVPADAAPFAYRRDPAEKRFHVTDRNGDRVGTYPSVAAIRRDGFAPVPSPFVPEHAFAVGSLRGRWGVLAVDGETGTLVAP